MMDRPLLISTIIAQAAAQNGDTEIVSRETHRPVFRHTWRFFTMNRHFPLAVALSLVLSSLTAVRAADDPPTDPTLAHDQAKAVSETVKHDAKVVADAAKDGAKQVAVAAKEVAHEVAVTTKEGAQEVAATAKRGAERAKAAVNGEKKPSPPARPADKTPASPEKAPAP
jgi:hypothetical protein